MRMWMVPPAIMCDRHLLGEHVEIHMFIGSINRGISMRGYLRNNLLEPMALHQRHEDLVHEIQLRGFKHASPTNPYTTKYFTPEDLRITVNPDASLEELLRRCPDCSNRYNSLMGSPS